ncbi:hypothetical protein E2I00_011478, partial [Balaenoptera physalus]
MDAVKEQLRKKNGGGNLEKASVIRPPRRWNYTLTLTWAGTSQSASSVVSDILRIDSLWQFENLRKLQLDNNVIEKIEGLENLTRLVWLGEAPIIYLRRFKDLRTLSLSGNPVAEAEDYRTCICAYLPDLVYLDFRRIDDQTKELAEMKHQYSVDELKHRESLMQARLEDERARREELAEHEDKFVIICLNIFEYGLKQQEKRKAERDTFMVCVQEAVQEKQEQGKHKIAKFEEKHLLSLSSIRDESELTNFEIKTAEYSEDITELANVLMTLEMQLVEQLEVRRGPGNTCDAAALPGSCAGTWRGSTFPGATRRVTRKLSVLLVLFSHWDDKWPLCNMR